MKSRVSTWALIVVAALALPTLALFIVQELQILFSRDTTVFVHHRRVVRDEQIKEVEKWRERTVPCVDVVELVPPGTPPQPGEPPERVTWRDRLMPWWKPDPEEAKQRFEEIFEGLVDLDSEHLLDTLEVPRSRYGWYVAATMPKAGDGPKRVQMTAVERKPPLFAVGQVSRWWLGIGGRAAWQEGEMDLEPAVAAGLERQAFSLRRWDASAHLLGEYGLETGHSSVRLYFGIGREHYRP